MRNSGKEVDIRDTRSFVVARVRFAGRRREVHLYKMPKLTNCKRGGAGKKEQPVRGGTGGSR